MYVYIQCLSIGAFEHSMYTFNNIYLKYDCRNYFSRSREQISSIKTEIINNFDKKYIINLELFRIEYFSFRFFPIPPSFNFDIFLLTTLHFCEFHTKIEPSFQHFFPPLNKNNYRKTTEYKEIYLP